MKYLYVYFVITCLTQFTCNDQKLSGERSLTHTIYRDHSLRKCLTDKEQAHENEETIRMNVLFVICGWYYCY